MELTTGPAKVRFAKREDLERVNELRKEGHYDHVELCVKKDDKAAIRLYEKFGFQDSGYVDEDVPDALNMIITL